MARSKAKAQVMEPSYIVMPLLALALASNLFLYMVSYTQSTFDRQAIPLPQVHTPAVVSMLNEQIDSAQSDIENSFAQATAVVKPVMVAFFGLEGYHYGMPAVQTSLLPKAAVTQVSSLPVIQSVSDDHGSVLGIMIVNPEYAQ